MSNRPTTTSIGRRTALRYGLAAAGAAATVGGLGAAAAAATTRAAGNPFVLTFLPWGGWPAYAGSHWQQFIAPAMQHFESQHPGVKVSVGAPQGGSTSILSAILAGQGPDVFQDWVMPPYLEAGAALNLKPFLEQDNIPLSTWSPGQMRTMETDTGIWALPTYVHGDAIAINLSVLDDLGIKYPDPNWDYHEAERLAREAAGKRQGKTQIYGWAPAGWTPWAAEYTWPFHLWGGAVRDSTDMKCIADQPQSYKGLQWYMQLYFDKVLYPAGDYPTSTGSIYNSHGIISAFQEIGSNSVPIQLRTWRDNIKWTYWSMPHFPGGQASFEADDFYMANAATKNVEATWEFMRFVTADPYWQHYCMKYMLRTPGMVALWDDWINYLEQASPVARNRNLQAYKDAALHYAVAPRYFKYDDTAVEPILNNAIDKAIGRQGDLVTLLTDAARRITAHESAAAARTGSYAVELGKLNAEIAAARKKNGNVNFGAPPTSGLGTAPKLLAKSAYAVKNGSYSITGSGGTLGGYSSDDSLTFACAPWSKGAGSFTCRLVSVSTVKGDKKSSMQDNTKIGLMARGDLSTEAATVAVIVAMGRSVQVPQRAVPAGTMSDQGTYNTSGLLGQSGLLTGTSKPVANYLLKPVWLRLVQNVNKWTAYASLDGKTWSQQGQPMGIEATAVWIGLCIAPAGGSGNKVHAVFDNVSFTPTAFYAVGG